MLIFRVIQSSSYINQPGFYLIPDNWDDWFEYEISYWLYDNYGKNDRIGRVKIAKKNQTERNTNLPTEFSTLGNNYVSVGFNRDYYVNLKAIECREEILKSLNDMAYNLEIYEEVKNMQVTRVALMREYSETRLKGEIHRMALGAAILTNYDFKYILPSVNPLTNENVEMSFEVKRRVKPFSNIHVIIGKNGIGKTTIIKNMIFSLEYHAEIEIVGRIKDDSGIKFANIVFVSFSAFDMPIMEGDFSNECPIKYNFVGLIKESPQKGKTVKSVQVLSEEFVEYSFNFYLDSSKMRLWKETIEILKSDNTFVEQKIDTWINDTLKNQWIKEIEDNSSEHEKISVDLKIEKLKKKHKEKVLEQFKKLSSGHKIILLTLASLVDLVEEKTLVFLDEPEEHLHPPLVSAFIHALSNLLMYRNGVAIVATHSPVIVQEVPKKCVWILERSNEYVICRRPEIETYGENLGELTTEIFGYEVIKAGFHKELENAVSRSSTYEEAKDIFDNQLGKEAKSILRAYMYDKEEQGEE